MTLEPAITAYQAGASLREAAVVAGCSSQWLRLILHRRGLMRPRWPARESPVWVVVSGTRRVRYHLVAAQTSLEARRAVAGSRGRRLCRVRAVRMDHACEALRAEAKAKGRWV